MLAPSPSLQVTAAGWGSLRYPAASRYGSVFARLAFMSPSKNRDKLITPTIRVCYVLGRFFSS